ncbi:MAG: endolytic transglycosylase MltG [Actinomycetota bacterium]
MKLTRRGRALVVLGIIAFFGGMVLLSGYLYLRSIGVAGPSDPGPLVRFEIPEGSSTSDIGKVLAEEGVIRSSFGFRIAAWLDGGEEDIQAGEYELPVGLSARDALRALVDTGPLIDYVSVTFPEGSWLTDFASILERDTHIDGDGFLDLVTSGSIRSKYSDGADTLEGLLFPSTYQVIEEDDARSVAERLVEQFEKQASEIDFAEVNAMGYKPYEAIIVASMIEAEAKVDADRAKIATVIYNRLREGIPLGIDATVLYALGEHKEELTTSDLAIESPYNTRVVTGLPPTPIGAAGMASLEAAAHPAEGQWLYYVLGDCEGHHAFSVDYEDFLADKAAFQALEC